MQSSSKKIWPKDEAEAATVKPYFNNFFKSKGVLLLGSDLVSGNMTKHSRKVNTGPFMVPPSGKW